MGNKKNLMPIEEVNSRRTREQHSADSRKAGKASGVARREKKALKETLEMLLRMPVEDGSLDDIDKIKSFGALNGKNVSVQEAVVMSAIQKALNGDIKAFKAIAEIMNDKAMSDDADGDENGVIVLPEVKVRE
jgi:hypothetical protein